jgi:hypothetical protein
MEKGRISKEKHMVIRTEMQHKESEMHEELNMIWKAINFETDDHTNGKSIQTSINMKQTAAVCCTDIFNYRYQASLPDNCASANVLHTIGHK